MKGKGVGDVEGADEGSVGDSDGLRVGVVVEEMGAELLLTVRVEMVP
jgi:hypothetical protein